MVKRYKDPEYLAFLRKLPCVVCGYTPKGNRRRYNDKTDSFDVYPAENAAHHIGDGVHSRRFNDMYAVPVCDHTNDPKSPNCHHTVVHMSLKEWDERLKPWIQYYNERFRASKRGRPNE